jgi:hypothetical protein
MDFLEGLRDAVQKGKVLIRKHADERAGSRKIPFSSVLEVISEGEVIEDYTEAKPFHACLFMKHVESAPLYVVCSFYGEYCYIITVHWIDPNKWHDPWTRRKL